MSERFWTSGSGSTPCWLRRTAAAITALPSCRTCCGPATGSPHH